jgi:ribosome biogenesis GTPase YqeH
MMFKKPKSSGLTAEIRVKRCYGCGAILQDKDPDEPGYVPPEKFASDDEVLCERCFKLRHYSAYSKSTDFSIDYVTILDHAKESDALVVYVLNAFSLYGSALAGIGNYLPSKVLVLINKRDLLPKSFADDYLRKEAEDVLAKENIKPLDILITSASSSSQGNIETLMEDIEKYRGGKDVYFIGSYQVGKSSLINALLFHYSNRTDKTITTSPYPGTTLDVISIPLDENSSMFDTPGIYNSRSVISVLEPEILKYVLPRNEVRPETYAAKEGQSFLFSNFSRLDFVKGGRTNFTFFKSNDLPITRAKVNKADEFMKKIGEDDSSSTRSKKISDPSLLELHSFHAPKGKRAVLRIYGLCFVEFDGEEQEINVLAPQGVTVTLSDASL